MTLSDRIISLELETITPLFAGGATPRRIDPYTPIRPSSVRGVMRYWFRAATAAVLVPGRETELVRELAKLETEVFGATDRASPFALLAPELDAKKVIEPFPPGEPDRQRWPGLRYLGYGLFEDATRGAQAIAERTRFTLRLHLMRDHKGLRELLSATLWLWLGLGALGARARRGYGAIRLYPGQTHGISWPEELLAPPADHHALPGYLARGKDWAWRVFHDHLTTLMGRRPPDRPDKDAAKLPMRSLAGIATFTPLPHEFADAREALDMVGRLFRDYRSTLERSRRNQAPLPDYTSVKVALQRGRPPTSVERAAFGLPLPFYFRSLGGQRTRFVPKRPNWRTPEDRMASPLCIRICPVGDAHSPRYVPVLYNWAESGGAEPLLGCEVWDERNRGLVARPTDNTIIQSFIEWARRQPRPGAGAKTQGRRR